MTNASMMARGEVVPEYLREPRPASRDHHGMRDLFRMTTRPLRPGLVSGLAVVRPGLNSMNINTLPPGQLPPTKEETAMLKLIITAAVLSAALAAPTFAAEMKCDEASMQTMHDQMMGMKDMAMKDKVMKEMNMAKDAMKGMKMEDCMKHMQDAMENMQ